ncbi:MAG TPA: S8 family peptidase, partial [Gemmataceae bacterium]|nr:S8 family peptidase [Gemmataceae bacterium]
MLRVRTLYRAWPAILAAWLALGGLVPAAAAQDLGLSASDRPASSSQYVDGEVLVKYRKTRINLATASGRASSGNFAAIRQLQKVEDLRGGNIARLKITDGKSVEQKVAELKRDPLVEYAEPNYRRELADIPTNDASRAQLWGLDNTAQTVTVVSSSTPTYSVNPGFADMDIDGPEAWALSEAGTYTDVIVAVIDTGVAYNHPDLAANMWDGSACKNENGVAIQGGCNHGYDYEFNDNTPLPSSDTHGTHVAGTIAAIKNNGIGIIGVAPRAKIMAIKFGLTTSDEVKSIDFAIQNGAKVINASYGGTTFAQAELDAIERFRVAGGLFVAAAGNFGTSNESNHFYPSDYTNAGIISVAATDAKDQLATFSDYGATSVDVGAPGTNILSTVAKATISLEGFGTVVIPALPTGWTKTGDWATFDNSGNTALGADPAHVPYLPNANSDATSKTYDLSGSGGLMMSWMASCDSEYITSGWTDYVTLDASANGTTFNEIVRWDEAELDAYNGAPADSTGAAQAYISNIPIPDSYATANFKYRFTW